MPGFKGVKNSDVIEKGEGKGEEEGWQIRDRLVSRARMAEMLGALGVGWGMYPPFLTPSSFSFSVV